MQLSIEPLIYIGIFVGVILLVNGIYLLVFGKSISLNARVNRRLTMLESGTSREDVLAKLRKELDQHKGSVSLPFYQMIADKAGYKRTALELGGNDPLIILNDLTGDDLDRAATIAVAGATGNSGQRCTAVKRILVQDSVADALVPLILEKAKAIRFGDPMDPDTQLGCVVHAEAAETFEDRVYNAEKNGAKVLYDPGRNGALLPPIVVDHVPHDSELVMEETFGPIVPIVRVPDDDAAVMRISNATAFGLSSGVCTNSLPRAQSYITGLNVGTVNIWEQPGYRIEMSPFGGIKDSGNGVKEGVLEAMKFFTNVKTYSLPWP